MKLGLIISFVMLAVLSLLGFIASRGVSDPTTTATSAEKLAQKQLPQQLPPVFLPSIPNGDASRFYTRALDFYRDNHETLQYDAPPKNLGDALVDLLIDAMQCQQVSHGFLDKHLPMQPGAMPDFDDALETIHSIVLLRAEQMYQEGNVAHAILATRAVWALGQRAYDNNTRLYNRVQGLTIMLDAGEKLYPWTGEMGGRTEQHIRDWMKVIHEIDQAWRAKYEQIAKIRPHVADLVNIAENDQDTTFRIAAVLKLGVAKFKPGGRGNKRTIMAAIEQAKSASDPLLVQAGIAAAGLTAEQMRRLH